MTSEDADVLIMQRMRIKTHCVCKYWKLKQHATVYSALQCFWLMIVKQVAKVVSGLPLSAPLQCINCIVVSRPVHELQDVVACSHNS